MVAQLFDCIDAVKEAVRVGRGSDDDTMKLSDSDNAKQENGSAAGSVDRRKYVILLAASNR